MKQHTKSIIIRLLLLLSAIFLISCGEKAVSGTPETTDAPITTAPVTEKSTTQETEPYETEHVYDFTTDPALYEAIPEEEYGLSENAEKKPCAFELEGTLRTATGTSLNIIVEWNASRNEGEDFVTINLDLAIEHKAIYSTNYLGIMTVNGEDFYFMSPYYEYSSSRLTREWLCPATVTVPCAYGEDTYVDISVKWDYVGKHEGRSYENLCLEGRIPIGEKYAALKTDINYEMENILQRPELPEGCEVTSLAILLNYLGFDVAHTYLADNYLEQGEVGKTSFYEMNLGNPREEGKSWGCYAPVIVKTANKYLADMKSYYRAYDYTGYDVSELYYQLSLGHPAIVWVTMDFAEPYLKKPWTVNGEKLYWKYPLHCVVISGYDMEKGTVTITDPLKTNLVTVDMETFELRWKQMESQAVVLKMSKLIGE
ncbi:MAG: C39 family peptidase [Clostridia bacterium]|nr:C39 family peptidase [Clostridia bacterium]